MFIFFWRFCPWPYFLTDKYLSVNTVSKMQLSLNQFVDFYIGKFWICALRTLFDVNENLSFGDVHSIITENRIRVQHSVQSQFVFEVKCSMEHVDFWIMPIWAKLKKYQRLRPFPKTCKKEGGSDTVNRLGFGFVSRRTIVSHQLELKKCFYIGLNS